MVTFRAGVTAAPLLHAVKRVVDKQLGGRGWDGVCVAVCMPGEEAEVARELLDAAEDACLLHGFEYVEYLDGRRGVRNDYGEPSGVDRVLEALEANDWSGGGDLGLSDEEEEEGEDGLKPIGDEIEREMFGLRSAIYANQEGEGDDIDEEKEVEKLEAAMAKMMMLKGMRTLDLCYGWG